MRDWVWIAAALVGALVLAIIGTTPPSAKNADAPAREFSAARAMVDVRAIASAPHPTGSVQNGHVRVYLAQRLAEIGFEVTEQRGPLDDYSVKRLANWTGRDERQTQLTNVIGFKPGTDRTLPAVALMAHHDTVGGSPGAADDTAGVAAILEAARAISASGPLRRDLYLVFTDGEELGLTGAKAFFSRHPAAGRIGAIVNLEARGGGGVANLFQLSPGNGAAARLYARAVSSPATSSTGAYLYSVLPNDTDLSVPLDKGGYVAYNIAFIGRSGLYHSPLAKPDWLDQGSLQQMGDHTLALARALGTADELPDMDEDAVFFDLFGLAAPVYAPWWGWVMLAVAVAGLGWAFVRGDTSGSVARGAGRSITLLIGAGVLLYGLNLVSGTGSGEYYDRLAAIPKLTGMAGLACLGAALLVLGKERAGGRTRIGAALPVVALGLAAQALVPTAGYFVVIAALFAGLVEASGVLAGDRVRQMTTALLATVLTGYLMALSFWAMQGVGPSMPWVVALPLVLVVMLLLGIWPGLARARAFAAVALVAALSVALWVRFDPIPPTVAVYASDKPA